MKLWSPYSVDQHLFGPVYQFISYKTRHVMLHCGA